MKYQIAEYIIDTDRYRISSGDAAIPAEPKVFDLLVYLIRHRDRVLSREELFREVWDGREVSDATLSNHVKSARKILGDSGELQKTILTIRGRGYQFIAPLSDEPVAGLDDPTATPTSPVPAAPADPPPPATDPGALSRSKRTRLIVVTGVLGAMALIAAGIAGLVGRRSESLRDRDSIVLAGFENRSGEPVFDFTLRQGPAAQLSQSPFLNIVPDERVRETLRLMGRTPDDRLDHDVALEVCRRQGVKAMLGGSIASLGPVYVLALDATNCQTGEAIAREQAEARGKERVLGALSTMASRLRSTLGESLASIQRFDVPIEQITTPSLEALHAYTFGQRARARGSEIESIAFFQP
jgi:DNA-binding winged helix-turn-helix (wHTH) protein